MSVGRHAPVSRRSVQRLRFVFYGVWFIRVDVFCFMVYGLYDLGFRIYVLFICFRVQRLCCVFYGVWVMVHAVRFRRGRRAMSA